MVGRTRARAGHSLPELIVAVTFLSTTVVAVGGTAVLGARWTGRAVLRQEAVRRAAAILDSVATAPGPRSGQGSSGGLTSRWRVDGGRGTIRVIVLPTAGGSVLVTLTGRVAPTVPVLPDDSAAPPAGRRLP